MQVIEWLIALIILVLLKEPKPALLNIQILPIPNHYFTFDNKKKFD